jgi:HK97 family phage major capsid protein
MKARTLFSAAVALLCAAAAGVAHAFGVDVVALVVDPHAAAGLILANAAVLNPTEIKQAVEAALKDLTTEHQKSLKEAKEATERALDEVKRLGTITTETNEKLKETSEKGMKVQTDLLELQQKMAGLKLNATPERVKTVGELVTESEQWKAAGKSGRPEMASVDVKTFFPGYGTKTAIVNATGQNQPLVMADRAPMVMPAERELVIRDLLPVRGTTSNLIEYVRENVFTNNAAIVYSSPNYENVTKPESGITFQMLTAAVATIAHWIPASRQVLADAGMLQGYIEDRLLYGLKYVEEDEILNGDGSAGHLSGLMTNATAYAGSGAVSADQQLDTLLRAFTQVYTTSLFHPDGAVVNPIDWMKIRIMKDTQGRYIFGDPNSNQTPSVWGKPLVQSLSIAATRFLTGAFRAGAMLWDREDANVRIAEQHGDFFIRNMVAILAEERLALTIFRPTAFVRGNFN